MYLKNFCDEQGNITVRDNGSNHIFKTGTPAVAAENDFYTLDKAPEPYRWEHAYAKSIEPTFGQLLAKIILQANPMTQAGAVIMNAHEKAKLSIMMIVQLLRGKQCREFEQSSYRELLPGVIENAREKYGSFDEEQKKLISDFETDEYFFKLISMGVSISPDRIASFADLLLKHSFVIYRCPGDVEFITSDNPVMAVDALSGDARPFSNGIAYAKTIVCFPISPRLLLCAYHPDYLLGSLIEKDCQLIHLGEKDKAFVRKINQCQIEQCYRYVFAHSDKAFPDKIKSDRKNA